MTTIVRTLFLAFLLALTGCGGTLGEALIPVDSVVEAVGDAIKDPVSKAKGATAGLSSSDARDVLIHGQYYGALKAVHGAQKEGAAPTLLVDIEPHEGQPIVIHAKRFKVYAPPATSAAQPVVIAEPRAKKPVWKEVSEEARGWVRDVGSVVVPIRLGERREETNRLNIVTNGDIRRAELGVVNTAITGSTEIAGQAIQSYKPPTASTEPATVAAPE